ncbi:MAG TPA: hypothetical protein VN648_08310 [Candidatus Methylomirabilis sp.]|nr:hypothetical protein [Candidatus Methylomirabilis sp.]
MTRMRICTLAGRAALAVLLLGGSASAAEGPANQVIIVLKDFTLEPPTARLHVGDAVVLTLRNEGKTAHEWLIGRGMVRSPDEKGFQQDLFALLNPTVEGRQYSLERVGRRPPGRDERATRTSRGVAIEPGGTVTLRFTVPASATGEWTMACFFTGHYETGMKGTLLIE